MMKEANSLSGTCDGGVAQLCLQMHLARHNEERIRWHGIKDVEPTRGGKPN
jgi:hypothetical protein